MRSVDFYAGAGPCYSFLITRDHSPYVHEKSSSNNWGFVAKSGFIYHCTKHLQVEGFVDYMYQEFHFANTDKDPFVYRTNTFLSGIEVGASVGYNF
jgi:outer membrane protein W